MLNVRLMKTHAEAQGREPFDWNEFLNKKEISESEWLEAKLLAGNWVTCACGNLCDIIPRYRGIPAPRDGILLSLGNSFSIQIECQNRREAKVILAEIENRSAEILKDLCQAPYAPISE